MKTNTVLIVDDEENIRLTLTQALANIEVQTETAMNGEEALAKLTEHPYGMVLLDLSMPGMDGMEVLRQLRRDYPEIRVVMITAHGTVELAMEAIKLGAVDFIQKPFTPDEIRSLVAKVLNQETRDADKAREYTSSLELAKQCVLDHHLEAAAEHTRKAIAHDPSRAEAFNLLGALYDIRGNQLEAQKHYRAAIAFDPAYQPALGNLRRSTGAQPNMEKKIYLDEETSL